MISLGDNLSATSKNKLVIGLALAIGFLLGFLTAMLIQSLNPQNRRATHEVFQLESPQSSTINRDRNSAKVSIEVGQFQEIFKHRSVIEQHKALYTTLAHSTEPELKDWWIHSQKIVRESQRRIAQHAILQSLTTINPQEALRSLEDVSKFHVDPLLKSVFSQWSITQLEDAIEAAITLSGSRRSVVLEAILETRDDLSNIERRAIAIQLESEETYLKLESDTLASQSIADPQDSWAILLNDDVDDSLQLESLRKVAEAWRAEIGFAVLSHAFAEGPVNWYQLVRPITQVELAAALNYVQGVEDEIEKQLLAQTIVHDWARTDAREALVAVATFQPPSSASRLESTVANAWASTDPFELIEHIELISDGNRMLSLETAFSKIAGRDPMEAIALVSSVENYVGNTSSIIQEIVFRWSQNDPSAAADWVVNNYAREDPQRQTLLESALRSLARQDPKQAFEIAIEQPARSERFRLEHIVIWEVTQNGDIELAKKLLPQVRESTKMYAYSQIGDAMVRASRTKDALELGEEIIEKEKDRYYRKLVSVWANNDAKDLYTSLEDLPTDNIQSQGALQLILHNWHSSVLTDDQIARARTFLNEGDEAALKRIEDR